MVIKSPMLWKNPWLKLPVVEKFKKNTTKNTELLLKESKKLLKILLKQLEKEIKKKFINMIRKLFVSLIKKDFLTNSKLKWILLLKTYNSKKQQSFVMK